MWQYINNNNNINKVNQVSEIAKLNKTNTNIQARDVKINQKALDIVNDKLPAITESSQAFGKHNSQSMLGLMTLTMMNGLSPMRLVRQVAAEIDVRRRAVLAAQVSLAKLEESIDELLDLERNRDLSLVEMAELKEKSTSKQDLIVNLNGSLKDLASLCNYYDLLISKHGIPEDWDEETFEKEEMRHHVRRAFELLYRNMLTNGRPDGGTMEYLAQHGVNAQVAIREVTGFLAYCDERINKGDIPSGMDTEDFLDGMADKYEHCPRELSQRMFGVEDFTNYEILYKKYK